MSTRKFTNISISQYESFLELVHCKFVKGPGGHHVKYIRRDLFRPIVFQNHIEPVPEFVVLNGLRTLGISKNEFWEILEMKKMVVEEGGKFVLKINSKR